MSELPGPEVHMGNTSGIGVSSLSKDHKMIIDETIWNEIFGESGDESAKGFEEVEKELNSIIEENDAKRKEK